MKKNILILVMLMISLSRSVAADWSGPTKIVIGTWGSADNQFDIKYGDTNDVFGGPFYILLDGRLIVTDLMNGRRKVYEANGDLLKVVKCVKSPNGEWNEECRIPLSDYIRTTSNGNIWVGPLEYVKQQGYSLYSPAGNLLKTKTARPVELGHYSWDTNESGGHVHTLKFPDRTYGFVLPWRSINSYQRDTEGNLIVAAQTNNRERVYRISPIGKILGEMPMPESKWNVVDTIGRERVKELEYQYGTAVIGPNGNIYTWKRTPDKYSIVKWTWQDDPKASKASDCDDKAKKGKKAK